MHVLLEAVRREAERTRAGERPVAPRFLQVSTDEVYGDVGEGRSVETDGLAPRSPYAAAKASSELLVRAYHVTFGLDVVITRGSNTYGPYQHPEKLIPLFVTNALAGEPLPMYGDGMQVRDWLHVSDHAAGIEFVLRHGESGEAYNLAGENERPNRDVIGQLLAATGRDWSLVRSVPDRPGHDRRYAMDGSKAAALGWRARVAFEDGPARHRGLVSRPRRVGRGRADPATGTPTTTASTGTGWRRAWRWTRPADRCGSRSPAPAAGWAGR